MLTGKKYDMLLSSHLLSSVDKKIKSGTPPICVFKQTQGPFINYVDKQGGGLAKCQRYYISKLRYVLPSILLNEGEVLVKIRSL